MTVINRSKVVEFSAAQMYGLVNDIDNYPVFLPWCTKSIVLSRSSDEIRAELTLSKGGLEKSFTTCNRLQENKMIEVRLVSGPFKQLEGFWRFEHLDDNSCKVSLDLEFEFSNFLISMALGPVFNQIANNLVDAFCQRALDLYKVADAG
ncbi:MAG: type II toxin-antitoxin system RatA family toxin [Gammaproteobacteria bacterium]|nr:type II toxin-antitoxin system RatA family toxin [Gammaproteobacteria bacterium]